MSRVAWAFHSPGWCPILIGICLITHPGQTVACSLWWLLLLRGLSLHSPSHHALCSQTLLFHTAQWGYAWGRGYIPWLKSRCLEFNLKQTPPFEKCSLSTFCIISDVSFARPCKHNAAGRAGCRAGASGLNSHMVQPETGSDRGPKVQGWAREKVPPSLGVSERNAPNSLPPGGSDGKESVCNAGDLGLIPESGKIAWRREWLPTPVFLPGEFHGQRNLAGSPARGRTRVGHDWANNTFIFQWTAQSVHSWILWLCWVKECDKSKTISILKLGFKRPLASILFAGMPDVVEEGQAILVGLLLFQ